MNRKTFIVRRQKIRKNVKNKLNLERKNQTNEVSIYIFGRKEEEPNKNKRKRWQGKKARKTNEIRTFE